MYAYKKENSLVTDDHVSEGVLVSLSDDTFMHIFRMDRGTEGDHTGNRGYIAKRTYANGKWSDVSTVYNSNQYDDRNIHGGITNDGRIVIFFRKYNANTTKTEGCYFIYSDDGEGWSAPILMETDNKFVIFGTGQMFYNPEVEKYCVAGYRTELGYCEMRFSVDGTNWDEKVVISETTDFKLGEIAGAYVGNSKMIVLVREDIRQANYPLIQMVSENNGQTWSEPTQTNIPKSTFWGSAPQLIYDDRTNKLIAMTNDRSSMHGGKFKEEKLYTFSANLNEIINDSNNWKLEDSFKRPKQEANVSFYGYPTIALRNEYEYFVVYTDRSRINGIEQADLYQFVLSTKTLTTVPGMKERVDTL